MATVAWQRDTVTDGPSGPKTKKYIVRIYSENVVGTG